MRWLQFVHVGVTLVLIIAVLRLVGELQVLDDAVTTNLHETELLRALVRACCAP